MKKIFYVLNPENNKYWDNRPWDDNRGWVRDILRAYAFESEEELEELIKKQMEDECGDTSFAYGDKYLIIPGFIAPSRVEY